MSRLLDAECTGVPLGGVAPQAVFLGASAGGPQAIESVLSGLPADFPVPVAICQHMPPGFTALWAERLDAICPLDVREARQGERLEPGTVYVAPIGRHMRAVREDGACTVRLDRDFADSLHVPSIDIFMSAAAQSYGSRALGVLLSGLGTDGALGMLALRRAGAYTLCQSPDSAVAPSMPSSAKELGAVAEEIHIDHMARAIARHVSGAV